MVVELIINGDQKNLDFEAMSARILCMTNKRL